MLGGLAELVRLKYTIGKKYESSSSKCIQEAASFYCCSSGSPTIFKKWVITNKK